MMFTSGELLMVYQLSNLTARDVKNVKRDIGFSIQTETQSSRAVERVWKGRIEGKLGRQLWAGLGIENDGKNFNDEKCVRARV